MTIELSKKELTVLSDTILTQMSNLRNVNKFSMSEVITHAVNTELKSLQELNSKICKLLDK